MSAGKETMNESPVMTVLVSIFLTLGSIWLFLQIVLLWDQVGTL